MFAKIWQYLNDSQFCPVRSVKIWSKMGQFPHFLHRQGDDDFVAALEMSRSDAGN